MHQLTRAPIGLSTKTVSHLSTVILFVGSLFKDYGKGYPPGNWLLFIQLQGENEFRGFCLGRSRRRGGQQWELPPGWLVFYRVEKQLEIWVTVLKDG